MSEFDWIAFFQRHSIEYVDRGSNVARGNVNVHCPFCGDLDPSHHLGVSLQGKGWGCWRDPAHRGKSPVKLIMALINCSKQEALALAGYGSTNLPLDLFESVSVTMGMQTSSEQPRVGSLKLLKEFRVFDTTKPSFDLFFRYLRKRGYGSKTVRKMSDRYGLRYCTTGPYKGRIIFPVYFDGRLVCWTGRSIYSSSDLRYKALSPDPEKANRQGLPTAIGPISDYLLWYDDLVSGGDTLCLVEGPFDALRVAVLGRSLGVQATCFFTQSPTDLQVGYLYDLLPRFRRKLLILDRGTAHIALRLGSRLASLGIDVVHIPEEFKDPGELTKIALCNLLK